MPERTYKIIRGERYEWQPIAIGTKQKAQKAATKLRNQGYKVRVCKSTGRKGAALIRRHGYNLWVAK